MSNQLRAAIVDYVRRSGDRGATMGEIVDSLSADGGAEREIESAVWALLTQRRLTPHGYVARKLRHGERQRRSYEFVLICWAPELDDQLELALSEDET